MHYAEIAQAIIDKGLRANVGANGVGVEPDSDRTVGIQTCGDVYVGDFPIMSC
jgi:hypothetical protein